MNTETIETRKVENGKMERPGDFCFADDFSYLYLWLPGDSGPDAIRIDRNGDTGKARHWGWDGNEDKPTLTPSILAHDVWHGFLIAGVLHSC